MLPFDDSEDSGAATEGFHNFAYVTMGSPKARWIKLSRVLLRAGHAGPKPGETDGMSSPQRDARNAANM